jgi:fatty acid desaturase
MAPNVRIPQSLIVDNDPPLVVEDSSSITAMLDKQADTNGLSNVNYDNEDWTDVKHSERKKRDRILDDGVLIKLMKKSDVKGFQRLFTNLCVMALTAYAIHRLDVFSLDKLNNVKRLLFLPLYLFFGFQFQCFAFAGQHEFLHRNAFKTKWINDVCLFLVGVFCFELGAHERLMHKQHHTFTNHIDKDPELTSYYSRETLENPGFRNLPGSRFLYFRQFLDILTTFKCRAGRIIFSAMGVPVDYSGTGWSLKEWTYSKESGIMRGLQMTALTQLTFYAAALCTAWNTPGGLQALLFWWFIPVLIGYPSVNYVRNLEHADCEVSKVSNCLRNTRSVRSNLFIRILLWDTNFHGTYTHVIDLVPCRIATLTTTFNNPSTLSRAPLLPHGALLQSS